MSHWHSVNVTWGGMKPPASASTSGQSRLFAIRMPQIALRPDPVSHPLFQHLRLWETAIGLALPKLPAIRFHHEPDVYDLPDKTLPGGAVSLIAVTHIAEHLANDLDGADDLEVGPALYQRGLAHFGIDGDEVEGFREALLKARAEL